MLSALKDSGKLPYCIAEVGGGIYYLAQIAGDLVRVSFLTEEELTLLGYSINKEDEDESHNEAEDLNRE